MDFPSSPPPLTPFISSHTLLMRHDVQLCAEELQILPLLFSLMGGCGRRRGDGRSNAA